MRAARFGFYGSVAAALTYFGWWYAFLFFWIVPFGTWHIAAQYARLICEHSAVESDEEEYAITRSTIPPWYRLPELHQALMERQGFRRHAVVRRSLLTSLGDCVRPDEAKAMAQSAH